MNRQDDGDARPAGRDLAGRDLAGRDLAGRGRAGRGRAGVRVRWEHGVLAVLVLSSGLVSSWNIGRAGYSSFYSTAARSMSLGWRAFAFGAFDPGASVTLDKLSGFLVPQALSARIFGFHPWALALPEVIEGMFTVVAGYLIGLRYRGRRTGLVAAAVLATTPLLASMFGHVMEDGLLTMSLALAFACWQSALRNGRLVSLLWCAVWVAVGFQAKMMMAWIILPGLAVGYLLGAPGPVARRVRQVALAGVATVVLSLAWITTVQLIAAQDRPYIDGSTNDNAYSMIFGYNGVNRIIPDAVPGAVGDRTTRTGTTGTAADPHEGTPVDRGALAAGAPGAAARGAADPPPNASGTKLLLPIYATQVGWLYPLTLGGLVLGLWPAIGCLRRSGPRGTSAPSRRLPAGPATTVALGLWLLPAVAVLSLARIPHTAYLAGISVQVAALTAIGFAESRRLLADRRPWPRTLPAVGVAVQLVWTVSLLAGSRVAPDITLPAVVVLGGAGWLALVVVSTRPAGRSIVTATLLAALAAVLLAPTLLTGSELDPSRNGSAGDAYAGVRPPSRAGSLVTGRPVTRKPAAFRIPAPFTIPPIPA